VERSSNALRVVVDTTRVSADRRVYDPSPAVLRILARRYGHKWIGTTDRGTPIFETIMPPPDLLAQAVAAGVMFTEPRTLDHDAWIHAAQQAVAAVTAREVGQAFLASLTSRRMDLRSALASYALTQHLPDHTYTERPSGVTCAVCGILRNRDGTVDPEDLNLFSQIRFGGGGLPGNIQYAAFDLEQFAQAPRLVPTSDDLSLGQQIIDYLRQLPPKTTAAQAARSLTIVLGTRDQRGTLMESLGICGILHSPGHPGYADAFIPDWKADTDWPSQRFPFGGYPTWWWKAEGGISDTALRQFLPQLT